MFTFSWVGTQEKDGTLVTIDGVQHPTIAEGARALGVSTRAVRDYINKGIIPQPPSVAYGLRDIDTFPSEYIKTAQQHIRDYKAKNKKQRQK